jgi:hypothetical protein
MDVTVQQRYGFTVGAKPWRRKRLVTQALDGVCGESSAPAMRSLLRFAEEKLQEGNLVGDELVRPDGEGKPLKGETPWALPA